MDQLPAQPRAPGSSKGHNEPPDEVVDVLAKSLQLGAGAGMTSTNVRPSIQPVREADL